MKNKGLRFFVLALITLAWVFIMRYMTSPLDPGLIIDLEFIGTARAANTFIGALQSSGQAELLTRAIFLDFVFPLLYGATLFYATAWICSLLPPKHLFNQFRIVSTMTVFAVIADFIENIALLHLIYYTPTDLTAMMAYLFAGIKFLLIGMVAAHFLASCFIAATEKRTATGLEEPLHSDRS